MSDQVKEPKKKVSKAIKYINADEYTQDELVELSKLYREEESKDKDD